MTDFEIRDLTRLDEFRAVVALEQEIWGYTDIGDIITIPVFIITVKRGGLLIGAFDAAGRMVGFAFSLVGMKGSETTQWSHMMGVVGEHRRAGLGRALKLAQRDRAMAAGFSLMEWTFDPLQALNAHLNFARLGVTCDEYARDFYGESTSALHKGTATDRFVVQWRLAEPHVERRVGRRESLPVRAHDIAAAPVVNPSRAGAAWRESVGGDLAVEAERLWVEVPVGFTEIQQQVPELAQQWRHHTRAIFEHYFGRGYRAVDFALDLSHGYGRYLFARLPNTDT